MAYWIFKTEPDAYSWDKLVADGKTSWTGIRNYQARNNLRLMKTGDIVFVYHTGEEKMIMGAARVTSDPYPDKTADKGDWVAIDIEPIAPFVRLVTLDEIRNTHGLSVMPIVSQSRLSVQPVTDAQAAMILKIAKTTVS